VPDRTDAVIVLTIYSRPECHLCDDMKAIVRRVAAGTDQGRTTLVEIDISGNGELEARYGLEVPVLLVNGKKAAKYRVTEGELRKRLEAEAGSQGRGQRAEGKE
jgi:alkyl hydroperoxide reductase subunit AhpF